MKEFVSALICGSDGKASLVNTMTTIGFLLFVTVTVYLVLSGKSWDGYTVFAGLTCGGSLLGKVGDKCINNVYAPRAYQREV